MSDFEVILGVLSILPTSLDEYSNLDVGKLFSTGNIPDSNLKLAMTSMGSAGIPAMLLEYILDLAGASHDMITKKAHPFRDPLTNKIMKSPVIWKKDGKEYDKTSLMEYFSDKNIKPEDRSFTKSSNTKSNIELFLDFFYMKQMKELLKVIRIYCDSFFYSNIEKSGSKKTKKSKNKKKKKKKSKSQVYTPPEIKLDFVPLIELTLKIFSLEQSLFSGRKIDKYRKYEFYLSLDQLFENYFMFYPDFVKSKCIESNTRPKLPDLIPLRTKIFECMLHFSRKSIPAFIPHQKTQEKVLGDTDLVKFFETSLTPIFQPREKSSNQNNQREVREAREIMYTSSLEYTFIHTQIVNKRHALHLLRPLLPLLSNKTNIYETLVFERIRTSEKIKMRYSFIILAIDMEISKNKNNKNKFDFDLYEYIMDHSFVSVLLVPDRLVRMNVLRYCLNVQPNNSKLFTAFLSEFLELYPSHPRLKRNNKNKNNNEEIEGEGENKELEIEVERDLVSYKSSEVFQYLRSKPDQILDFLLLQSQQVGEMRRRMHEMEVQSNVSQRKRKKEIEDSMTQYVGSTESRLDRLRTATSSVVERVDDVEEEMDGMREALTMAEKERGDLESMEGKTRDDVAKIMRVLKSQNQAINSLISQNKHLSEQIQQLEITRSSEVKHVKKKEIQKVGFSESLTLDEHAESVLERLGKRSDINIDSVKDVNKVNVEDAVNSFSDRIFAEIKDSDSDSESEEEIREIKKENEDDEVFLESASDYDSNSEEEEEEEEIIKKEIESERRNILRDGYSNTNTKSNTTIPSRINKNREKYTKQIEIEMEMESEDELFDRPSMSMTRNSRNRKRSNSPPPRDRDRKDDSDEEIDEDGIGKLRTMQIQDILRICPPRFRNRYIKKQDVFFAVEVEGGPRGYGEEEYRKLMRRCGDLEDMSIEGGRIFCEFCDAAGVLKAIQRYHGEENKTGRMAVFLEEGTAVHYITGLFFKDLPNSIYNDLESLLFHESVPERMGMVKPRGISQLVKLKDSKRGIPVGDFANYPGITCFFASYIESLGYLLKWDGQVIQHQDRRYVLDVYPRIEFEVMLQKENWVVLVHTNSPWKGKMRDPKNPNDEMTDEIVNEMKLSYAQIKAFVREVSGGLVSSIEPDVLGRERLLKIGLCSRKEASLLVKRVKSKKRFCGLVEGEEVEIWKLYDFEEYLDSRKDQNRYERNDGYGKYGNQGDRRWTQHGNNYNDNNWGRRGRGRGRGGRRRYNKNYRGGGGGGGYGNRRY